MVLCGVYYTVSVRQLSVLLQEDDQPRELPFVVGNLSHARCDRPGDARRMERTCVFQ